jgi:hypothetical protein
VAKQRNQSGEFSGAIYRPTRNGLPAFRPYVRGARRPQWMIAALQIAEERHGPPVPTCLHCGGQLAGNFYRCHACGWVQ